MTEHGTWVAQGRNWQINARAGGHLADAIEIVGLACDKVEQLDRELTAARAAYQEAQLHIAGLEAERDHFRVEAARLRERHAEAVALLEKGSVLTEPLFRKFWAENVAAWLAYEARKEVARDHG